MKITRSVNEPVYKEYTLVISTARCLAHNVHTSGFIVARGNEPHQKTEAGPSESVSIPLRHSKPGIMVTTATLQADAVAVDLLAAPPSGLNPHRSTVTRGRVFGRPQLLQQQVRGQGSFKGKQSRLHVQFVIVNPV